VGRRCPTLPGFATLLVSLHYAIAFGDDATKLGLIPRPLLPWEKGCLPAKVLKNTRFLENFSWMEKEQNHHGSCNY
jgi:hypothetical protein